MPKVLFVAPIYRYYPILVHALQLQTHEDWELLLIHDGPDDTELAGLIQRIDDPRIRFHQTAERHNDWGHSLRALALKWIEQEPIDGDYVVITNADNYYVPGFIEATLPHFGPETVAVCCGMAHDQRDWIAGPPELHFGRIDCGSAMVTREAALTVGWTSRQYAADWEFFQALLARYGKSRIELLPNTLFVHN